MRKPFEIYRPLILSALTVAGMLLSILGLWPLHGSAASAFSVAGLSLV